MPDANRVGSSRQTALVRPCNQQLGADFLLLAVLYCSCGSAFVVQHGICKRGEGEPIGSQED